MFVGQLDDHVEPFLGADGLGQSREDRASLPGDLLGELSLVRVEALPPGHPLQQLRQWHLPCVWPGRRQAPVQRRVQQQRALPPRGRGHRTLEIAYYSHNSDLAEVGLSTK